jgi:jumonji domain-containing protein 7
MYAVLRGEKEFLLLPPDWEGVKCQEFPAYRYNNDLDLEPATATGNGDPPTIHWFPESDEILAGAFRIKVSAGDVLYLPSEYYHHVQQSGDICIAVNCWFECDL